MSGPLRPGRDGAASRPLDVQPLGARTRRSARANPLGALLEHRLFDRLIRGRAWIGLVAFALIGIVTMQLGLLKLNAGIGRALEHQAALQRENSALSVEDSELAAGNTIELQAAHMGMEPIPAGVLRFLSAGHDPAGIADRAAAVLRARASAAAAASASASQASPAAESTPAGETGEAQTGAATSEAGATPQAAAATSESAATSAASGAESTPGSTAAPGAGQAAPAGPAAPEGSSEAAEQSQPAPQG